MLAREEYEGGRAFELVTGDLLSQPVDAIVNAANGQLAHGGGVAAAIARAAGPELERDGDRIVKERGPLRVGEAVATSAGRLPYKAVIHAVGPIQGLGDEEDSLVRALVAAFRCADERGYGSLAFPAVSSGIFAVPHAVCARAYVRAAREFLGGAPPPVSLKRVRLCLLEGPLVELVRRELEARA
jgi:O-acetyl-ADP-ribose deacetylase (regulator of RNase III)